MKDIEKVPYPLSGTNDTVQMTTECGYARLSDGPDGEKPEKHPCKLSASKDRGLLNVLVSEKKVLVSVRLDDAREIIKAADEAYDEVAADE